MAKCFNFVFSDHEIDNYKHPCFQVKVGCEHAITFVPKII